MTEFSWNPFGEAQDERVVGPPYRPTSDQADKMLDADLAEMFPEGWRERREAARDSGVENG